MHKTKLLIGAIVPALTVVSVPAKAQLAVVDHTNLAKAIETARNTLTLIDRAEQQIAEAQKLYDAGNRITDIGNIAGDLNSQFLQRGIPDDIRNVADLSSADLSDLGSIGQRAQELLSQRGYSTAAAEPYSSGFQSAARDQAIAENGLTIADHTTQGLGELKSRLNTAQTEKEVDDLQARATLEVAQLLNQANQRQAMLEAQNAALRLRNLDAAARNSRAEEDAMKSRNFMPALKN